MTAKHRDPYKTLAKLLLFFAAASLVVLGLVIGAAGHAITDRLSSESGTDRERDRARPAPVVGSTPLPTNCTHYLTAEGTTCAGINGSRQPWEGML